MAGIRKSNKSNILLDKEGKIIPDVQGKLKKWKEYIQQLFEYERQQMITQETAE